MTDLCDGLTDEACARLCDTCLSAEDVWFLEPTDDEPARYVCTVCAHVWAA